MLAKNTLVVADYPGWKNEQFPFMNGEPVEGETVTGRTLFCVMPDM
jgi:hypothetical protein